MTIDLSQLTLDSTIGNLPSHHFQVSLATPGQVVAQTFAHQPEIPGVIIEHKTRLVGMISRRKFYEWMSQPYSIELYMTRPIKVLLDYIKTNPLQLSETCQIDAAAQMALNRHEESIYEPIAILFKNDKMRLLDMQVLLLGQAHISSLLNDIIRRQEIESQEYLDKIKSEQKKVSCYANLLELNLLEMQKQNQKLEEKSSNILNQSREIAQLNEKFLQIGKLLSVEGKNAFRATFAGVNEICRTTNQIDRIGKALAKELETVNAASRLISQVSRQVRYLGVQAAIAANRVSGPFNDFSTVISEMGKLVSHTFEAGHQMDQLANRFKMRMQELAESAREGASAARSLIQKIEKAEVAIAELEELVKDRHRYLAIATPEEGENLDVVEAQFLLEKIERAEGSLVELEEVVKHQDVKRLIQELELALNRSKQKIV